MPEWVCVRCVDYASIGEELEMFWALATISASKRPEKSSSIQSDDSDL
jgi:hypothetical protein